MTHESRASDNCPERSDKELSRSGVACAAGPARPMWGAGRPGDMSFKKPIADEDREALKRLVETGKMIRRKDGRYGTAAKAMITNVIAARLKARELAVTGYGKPRTMYPSDKGRRLYAEMSDAGSN
jgi:hypothetical protein